MTQADLRLLSQRSGDRCAFPGCRRPLSLQEGSDAIATAGDAAHIVAESPDGPRGASPLTREQRDAYPNRVLMCRIHHQLIDAKPATYTVAALAAMKAEHEAWVQATLGRGVDVVDEPPLTVSATLHSTMLPVESLPGSVYSIPCTLTERDVAAIVRWPHSDVLVPYIVRSGRLYTFTTLGPSHPFEEVSTEQPRSEPLASWLADSQRSDWLLALLNQALTKFMRHRGLVFAKEHRRYYFAPRRPNETVEIDYRSMNQKRTRTAVVWRPIRKSTGEPRTYWYHRAARLRFVRATTDSLVLSIRPELHLTKDGLQDYAPRYVGGKVTRKKSRWFNYELLREVHLWRDFLSESRPRIIFRFGGSSAVIGSRLLSADIVWPGIPAEHDKPFANVEAQEDIFSWAALAHRDDPLADEAAIADEHDDPEVDDDDD